MDKPKYINRGYGKEALCKPCDEYYLLNDDNFYRVSPSSQPSHVVAYENLCKACYNFRKARYRANKKAKANDQLVEAK